MRFARGASWVAAGVLVWALHFAAIYGFTALACARGLAHVVPTAIGAASAIALVAVVAIIVSGWRRRAHFEHRLSASLAALALLAIVYETIPAWTVPACV